MARLAFAARLGSAALRPDAATSARDLTGAVDLHRGALGRGDGRAGFLLAGDPRLRGMLPRGVGGSPLSRVGCAPVLECGLVGDVMQVVEMLVVADQRRRTGRGSVYFLRSQRGSAFRRGSDGAGLGGGLSPGGRLTAGHGSLPAEVLAGSDSSLERVAESSASAVSPATSPPVDWACPPMSWIVVVVAPLVSASATQNRMHACSIDAGMVVTIVPAGCG